MKYLRIGELTYLVFYKKSYYTKSKKDKSSSWIMIRALFFIKVNAVWSFFFINYYLIFLSFSNYNFIQEQNIFYNSLDIKKLDE